MTPGDRLTLSIEKAVAGGRMLARHEGAIVLVSGAIPGERVEVEVEQVRRGTIWAAVHRVIEASNDRVTPFCDPQCGGSVYAHVRYERQLDLKREILRDAFSRIAHLTLTDEIPVAASPADGYRMRARLHLENGRIGFFKEGTHTLCEPAPTKQLREDTLQALGRLANELRRADRARVAAIELSENRDGSERACHLELAAGGDPSRLAAFSQVEGLTGVSAGSGLYARPLTVWGLPAVTDVIGGARLTRHARAFFQGNRFLVEALGTRVSGLVPSGPTIDLYAGVGLFSAMLAARGDGAIVAVEGDAIAADDLKRNLAPFGAAAAACHQPVEVFLANRRRRAGAETVLVDPPRAGVAKAALEGIAALNASRVVYVSCDAATLARDAGWLASHGYRLRSVEAFDMFPNTAHVETVALLSRDGA
jgi:23S rRNA (uracil1939-C5)-methyltransferase